MPSAEPIPGDVSPRTEPPATKRPSRTEVVLPALLALFAVLRLGIYLSGRGKESTDHALVEGHVATVASRVPRLLQRVLVKDNQEVSLGTLLVELTVAEIAVLRQRRAHESLCTGPAARSVLFQSRSSSEELINGKDHNDIGRSNR